MKIADLLERIDSTMRVPQTRHVTLYFGCCRGAAEALERTGFTPSVVGRKYLSLVSTPEMAKTKAGFRNCDAVVEVSRIPANYLQVDIKAQNAPSDIWSAIDAVNNGDEVILKLFKELGAGNFKYINKTRRK